MSLAAPGLSLLQAEMEKPPPPPNISALDLTNSKVSPAVELLDASHSQEGGRGPPSKQSTLGPSVPTARSGCKISF